mgnify:CR=1 FL=1
MHNANRSPAPGSLTRKATEYLESKLKEGYKLTVEYDSEASMVRVEFLRSEPFGQATTGSDTFADAMNRIADPDYYSAFSETVDRALDALDARKEAQTPFALVFESKFHFTSNQHQAHCHLKLYKLEGTLQTIVVATEVNDNPGQSITNGFQELAESMTAVFGLSPSHTLWVEHYNSQSYKGEPLEHEETDRYSLVTVWDGEQFSEPHFSHLDASHLQQLCLLYTSDAADE